MSLTLSSLVTSTSEAKKTPHDSFVPFHGLLSKLKHDTMIQHDEKQKRPEQKAE